MPPPCQVANGLPPRYPGQFVYKVIPVFDEPETDLAAHFDGIFAFIEAARLGTSPPVPASALLPSSDAGPSSSAALEEGGGGVDRRASGGAPSSTPAVASAEAPAARVLVHCLAGVSRSATAVLAYLLFSKRASSVHEALDLVRKVRPVVYPNDGFMRQLLRFNGEPEPPPILFPPPPIYSGFRSIASGSAAAPAAVVSAAADLSSLLPRPSPSL